MPGEEAIGYQMYANVHCSNADGYLIILGLWWPERYKLRIMPVQHHSYLVKLFCPFVFRAFSPYTVDKVWVCSISVCMYCTFNSKNSFAMEDSFLFLPSSSSMKRK